MRLTRRKKTVEEISLETRAAILRGEEKAGRRILALYERALASINRELRVLEKKIAAAELSGLELTPAWIYREARLLELLAQVRAEINEASLRASLVTQKQQKAAVASQVASAREELKGLGLRFVAVPNETLRILAGRLSDGTPLRVRFLAFGPEVASAVEEALFEGVSRGIGSAKIARNIRKAVEIVPYKALRIARTEALGAGRTAKLEAYRESGITKYRRLSAHGPRTCAACLALDGKVFDSSELFPSHPNCRCTMAPFIEGRPSRYLTGDDWLELQDGELVDGILGSRRAGDLYREGKVALADFVKPTFSADYGPGIVQRSLRSVEGIVEARGGAVVRRRRAA
jgi:SPP1 gp7 family putative phage head morphogenesis protein